MKKTKKCKTRRCNNPAKQLGVCSSCYSVVWRAISAGELTWDQAEERGLVEKAQRKRSPMRDLIKP